MSTKRQTRWEYPPGLLSRRELVQHSITKGSTVRTRVAHPAETGGVHHGFVAQPPLKPSVGQIRSGIWCIGAVWHRCAANCCRTPLHLEACETNHGNVLTASDQKPSDRSRKYSCPTGFPSKRVGQPPK